MITLNVTMNSWHAFFSPLFIYNDGGNWYPCIVTKSGGGAGRHGNGGSTAYGVGVGVGVGVGSGCNHSKQTADAK